MRTIVAAAYGQSGREFDSFHTFNHPYMFKGSETMTTKLGDQPDCKRDAVHRFLSSIADAAMLDAERVAVALERLGHRPASNSERRGWLETNPAGPAFDMLLNLAAALRIRRWERAGLASRLPDDLPSAAEALAAAASFGCALAPPADSLAIPKATLRVFIERFSRSGRSGLGVDVFVEGKLEEPFLDAFAAALLGMSQFLNQPEKGGETNGSENQEPRQSDDPSVD